MAEDGVFSNRLDLLLCLVDTTTGMEVTERNIRFTKNGRVLQPVARGPGNYILINTGRDNGLMLVEVFGYEPYSCMVDYEKLSPTLPRIDVFLIPSENRGMGEALLTYSGTLKGLRSLTAVNPERPVCSIREFDAKRRIMSVFMPNRSMNMYHTYYGLCNIRDGTFEGFEVEQELFDGRLKTRRPLEKEFVVNSPVCRLLFGSVDEEGNYLLRVRNSAKKVVYLVRFESEDSTEFKYIDFTADQ